MRIILLLLLSFNICFSQNTDLSLLRNSFVDANKSEQDCNTLLEQSELMMKHNDIAKAYNATGLMISCQFKVNPIVKWNTFNCGKKILEELIEKNKSNLEMRFLRYCMQKKAPSFLNYKDKIEEDQLFINSVNTEVNKELLDFINPIFTSLNNE
jgi:hypothetical protein